MPGGDLTALELGDEAIVNVADFSLSGRSMRNVRQMVNRVAKNGYEAEVRRVGDIPRQRARQAHQVSDDRWRGSQTERGFSMALGRLGAVGDEECVVVTAKEDGVLRAVLQFVPWGTDGLSLDLMRRDRAAQPGLNDFLIVEAIKAAPGLGRQAHLAELRDVPRRARARRADRRRPGARAWRSPAGVRLALVPDRVALQVQREVLPGLGAAVLRVSRDPRHAADRDRGAGGGGVPGLAQA